MANRNRMIAAVHAAARDQGLDEDARRALMQTATGKRSCADMTTHELAAVLDRLNDRGHPHLVVIPTDADDRHRLLKKIKAQLNHAHLPDAYADGIAKKMFGQSLSGCSLDQLRKVIAALNYHQKRLEKEHHGKKLQN